MDFGTIAHSCAFDAYGSCAASDVYVHDEVREMCAADRCHMYAHNWTCPPACGAVEEYQDDIAAHGICYVVQTVGQLEDCFDIENMLQAERLHKERMLYCARLLREAGIDALVLSSGACTLCESCAYPDAPCRMPDKQLISMEAAGLVVSEVCTLAGIAYNYGELKIAYTGAVFI